MSFNNIHSIIESSALERRFDVIAEPILPDDYYATDARSPWNKRGLVA